MTCVIPAAAIIEILNGPELSQMREALEVKLEPAIAAQPALAEPES
jgi:hypothetical protein